MPYLKVTEITEDNIGSLLSDYYHSATDKVRDVIIAGRQAKIGLTGRLGTETQIIPVSSPKRPGASESQVLQLMRNVVERWAIAHGKELRRIEFTRNRALIGKEWFKLTRLLPKAILYLTEGEEFYIRTHPQVYGEGVLDNPIQYLPSQNGEKAGYKLYVTTSPLHFLTLNYGAKGYSSFFSLTGAYGWASIALALSPDIGVVFLLNELNEKVGRAFISIPEEDDCIVFGRLYGELKPSQLKQLGKVLRPDYTLSITPHVVYTTDLYRDPWALELTAPVLARSHTVTLRTCDPMCLRCVVSVERLETSGLVAGICKACSDALPDNPERQAQSPQTEGEQ